MNHITLQVQVCIQEEFLIIFNIHNIVSKKYKYTKKTTKHTMDKRNINYQISTISKTVWFKVLAYNRFFFLSRP